MWCLGLKQSSRVNFGMQITFVEGNFCLSEVGEQCRRKKKRNLMSPPARPRKSYWFSEGPVNRTGKFECLQAFTN